MISEVNIEDEIILLGLQEVPNDLHKPFPLFPLRHMAGFGKRHPLDLGYLSEERLNGAVLSFVIASIDQQRSGDDLMRVVVDVPIFQCTYNMKLRWSVPVPAVSKVRGWSHALTYMVRYTVGSFLVHSKLVTNSSGMGFKRHR